LTKLIIAYNAKGGFFNGLSDSVHKIFSPSTYPCELCAITHHSAGMRYPWKRFLESLDMEVVFVHSDEVTEYPFLANEALPLIGVVSDGEFQVLVSKAELKEMKSVKELRVTTENQLAAV
jgi:CRP-like cAMP-binding protein